MPLPAANLSAAPQAAVPSHPGIGIDQALHAVQARATLGISPVGPALAALDWAAHMANSPGLWLELQRQAWAQAGRFATSLAQPGSAPAISPAPTDHRFNHPGWSTWPFNAFCQGFLLAEEWALRAATAPPGVARENVRIVTFAARQAMDTRMPTRMHTEYLQRLFLDNDLAEGRSPAGGEPVTVADIDVPIFAVSTEADHIAPWRSVYKIGLLTDGDLTFVLTSGGHNAGIVSEPGHHNRHFRINHRPHGAHHAAPEAWQAETPAQPGSWWPAWAAWLAERSSPPSKPPASAGSLAEAPGTYVLER